MDRSTLMQVLVQWSRQSSQHLFAFCAKGWLKSHAWCCSAGAANNKGAMIFACQLAKLFAIGLKCFLHFFGEHLGSPTASRGCPGGRRRCCLIGNLWPNLGILVSGSALPSRRYFLDR